MCIGKAGNGLALAGRTGAALFGTSKYNGAAPPEYEAVKTPQALGRRGIFDFDGADSGGATAASPQFASAGFNPFEAASAAKRKSFMGA